MHLRFSVLFSSLFSFLFLVQMGCTPIAGTGSDPDDAGVSDVNTAPARDFSDEPLGTLQIKIFDAISGDLLCDKSSMSQENARNENFTATYIYQGDATKELFSYSGGESSTQNEVRDVASLTFKGIVASSGDYDVPPAKEHQWNNADLVEWESTVTCGTSTEEGGFGPDSYTLVLTNNGRPFDSFDFAMSAYESILGWENAGEFCPSDLVASTCEVGEGRSALSMSFVGFGNGVGTDLELRAEVSFDATHVSSLVARETVQ